MAGLQLAASVGMLAEWLRSGAQLKEVGRQGSATPALPAVTSGSSSPPHVPTAMIFCPSDYGLKL